MRPFILERNRTILVLKPFRWQVGTMLRLSKLSDYSTVIMAHMAQQPERVYSAAGLAQALNLGAPTVSKLLKIMTRAGLVMSRRGTHGGYVLARGPESITLAEIIDAVEGPIGMTECSVASGACAQEDGCAVRPQWQYINRLVFEALDRTRLSDFARPPAHRVAWHDAPVRSSI